MHFINIKAHILYSDKITKNQKLKIDKQFLRLLFVDLLNNFGAISKFQLFLEV